MNTQMSQGRPARRPFARAASICIVLVMAFLGSTLSAAAGQAADAPLAAPQSIISIGDYVWCDYNQDGDHVGSGNVIEQQYLAGIGNVALDLEQKVGSVWVLQASTTTGSNGWYEFPGRLSDTEYQVVVNPSNFGPGGALEGLTLTSAGVYFQPFTTTSLPYGDADFGFSGCADWGDLPDQPYPTLAASNGPRHLITSPLRLGATIDAERNGQPDATATGDDTNGSTPDDETGVSVQPGMAGYPTWTDGLVSANQGGSLQIVISGGNGVPQVFIDFPGDAVVALTPVTLLPCTTPLPSLPWSPGTYRVCFDVPVGAMANDPDIPVRVRLSSAGGLGETGLAPDGEVEDYIISFKTTAVSLASFSAGSTANLLLVGLGGGAVVAALAVWGARRRRAIVP